MFCNHQKPIAADVMPLEEEEDGFSTEYLDAPVPQPPFGGAWRGGGLVNRRSPVLLNMQGEREMWVSYQTERRRARTLVLLLGLMCLVKLPSGPRLPALPTNRHLL